MASLEEYFLQGVAEFNQQRYFDCHETLEFLWNQLTDPQERNYVQGILQIGVSLHHYQKKNKQGYLNILEKGKIRLESLMQDSWQPSLGPNSLPWVDLIHLMNDMDDLFHERLDGWMPILLIIPAK